VILLAGYIFIICGYLNSSIFLHTLLLLLATNTPTISHHFKYLQSLKVGCSCDVI